MRYMYLFELEFSFNYMLRSEVSGSFGNSMFGFLRKLHIVFHSGYANLHSHKQCRRLPSLHILPSVVTTCLFDDSHSNNCKVIHTSLRF